MYLQRTANAHEIAVAYSYRITLMQWNPKEDGFIEKKQEIIDLAKLDKLNVKEIHRRIGGQLGICCHTFRKYFKRHIARELTKPKKRALQRPADKAVEPTSKRSEDARLNADAGKPAGTDDKECDQLYIDGEIKK